MRGRCALVTAVSVLAATALFASSAEARVRLLAFSVNDYGKDGPTKDALSLLDRYIADWAKAQGIKSYTVGTRDVNCKLFLNLIVVDEHTCKATAQVCWPDR